MTDFETHPAGTAARIAELTSAQKYRYIGKDGKPVLARDLEDRIEQLEAALTRANAATAAAYEVAAQVCENGDEFDPSTAIRALATPDQTAALDKLISEAVRPLINAADAMLAAFCVHENSAQIAAYAGMMNTILAASKKGGV